MKARLPNRWKKTKEENIVLSICRYFLRIRSRRNTLYSGEFAKLKRLFNRDKMMHSYLIIRQSRFETQLFSMKEITVVSEFNLPPFARHLETGRSDAAAGWDAAED